MPLFKRIRNLTLTHVIVALTLLPGCVTPSEPGLSPREVVQRFCELDFDGARLSSDTYGRIKTLVTWRKQTDMDPVYVISTFTVGDPVMVGDVVEVPVHYDIVRRMSVPWKPAADDVTDPSSVTFRLVRKGEGWVIDSPMLTPRSSAEALARVIRSWPQAGWNNNDSRLTETLEYLDSLDQQ